ncbi:hypothetical protein NBRC111894_3036 [Sporolactobacillus inulinus]|uniref:DUF4064 domain-containing protein n=1 Tax=Sporolactobacillus inulinus TaxID=2078 RepID=A0A4Y1ZE91_9BACL|nr:hypothetical protein [Sporolactobacillus inulinus]GAY77482.1 hypothetical protein NBRC111894_3036 [Sporolactobacillus inulinus]
MNRRVTACIIASLSVLSALIQSLFGGFTFLRALWAPSMRMTQLVKHDPLSASGALRSLISFGSHAFMAGGISAAMSGIGLYLFMRKGFAVVCGLLFLLAGSLNCLILYGTGLPVAVLLICTGMIMLALNSNPILPKQQVTNKHH